MEITVQTSKGTAVVHCRGSLDANSIATFKASTSEVIGRGVMRLIIDGEHLTFIDSMGLGVLISLLRRLKKNDGEVKVAALTPDVYSIFEITRLNRLFDICETTGDAQKRFTTKAAS